jgi:ATP-dependent DNA helicase RecQ
MNTAPNPASPAPAFAPRCLSIDLEVGRKDGRIHQFAAIRGDTGETFVFSKGNLAAALKHLDRFAEGLTSLLGHNLVAFDAAHLAAASPGLGILTLPRIDTLQLNPLAFPRNPYHHLVKHYQDGQLKRGRVNDPAEDAQTALALFSDQYRALVECQEATPDLLTAWHWLTTEGEANGGLSAFFSKVRGSLRPSRAEAIAAIHRRLEGQACQTYSAQVIENLGQGSWPLAYVLAWLSVAGGNSVMPPWVRHQFPEAGRMVRLLRDTACTSQICGWCRSQHDATAQLTRWFGFPGYRPEPTGPDGRPLQMAIVEAAMANQHVLGILPTGTGKSLCYQVPALSRFEKTGALTVVISPLVALMADQVTGLERHGIGTCAALNGLLSMPERADVLDRVRLGDVGILIVSPEQLRNRTFRRVLEQREIGAWVLDEAHCLSKWGHDFRPDYRYVSRFIRERARDGDIPPVLCLTATAKPEVIDDIVSHFLERVGIELGVFDGGMHRTNLEFAVVATTKSEKFAHVFQILESDLPPDVTGGAIVYCATRRNTEELSAFLQAKGMAAAHFHAGLQPETKKNVQKQFIEGELRVITATNAFGMGIDKPDVRVVVHADIPGSLENYLQEAGRAGRDREAARCVLLYTPEDVEKQFSMSARSRLTQREIKAILKSLRWLDRKKRLSGEVVATAGEILAEETDGNVVRDSATDDTRVRTAVSWLEEARLLTREENQVSLFPSSLRIKGMDDARARLAKREMVEAYRNQLLAIVEALLQADPDEGVSTDELMGRSGLSSEGVRKALHDLEALGISSNDTALTAFLHIGVERPSLKRFDDATAMESALIARLQEEAPDLGRGDVSALHLRRTTQALLDAGIPDVLPEKLRRLLKSLASDGQGEDSGKGSLRIKGLDQDTLQVTLLRDWPALAKTAELRRKAARLLLDHLLSCLPQGARGTDLLAETTVGRLTSTLETDLFLKAEIRDFNRLLESALLWLHEQEVIRLNKGLAVFRAAMTIRLDQQGGQFLKADFEPLQQHYHEQVVQIHVMAEYVQRGLITMADALRLTMDYFTLDRAAFLERWLPDREKLYRQTLPESWKAIVEDLNNPIQQRIVADDREKSNVLVLAGPGSGKTRVLVHRIAYLVRVRRENPRGILALAYNRHAATEIRERLAALIGDDARGVMVMTCHALAMRLTGHSFAGQRDKLEDGAFKEVLREAAALLRGEGLPPDEADEQRDRLLAGFRWILVDEYQDVEADQYELISGLAGRSRQDEDGRLGLFAVGDDDQNIYAFSGASVEYIRKFEDDYAAQSLLLTENYRSSKHIIAAANLLIEPAHNRMKIGEPIRINRKREREPPGGILEQCDPVGRGRVQIIPTGDDPITQAVAVMGELERLAQVVPDWSWSRTAVIARNWDSLDPVRSYCELNGIPVQSAAERGGSVWRLREVQALVNYLRADNRRLIESADIHRWLEEQPAGAGWELLRGAADEYAIETGGQELPVVHCIEWLAEWAREVRREQQGLLLLSAHRAKGLEFDHVAILDGNWGSHGRGEDLDAPRRLLYVAMTRARQSLVLGHLSCGNPMLAPLPEDPCLLRRSVELGDSHPPELSRKYLRLSMKDVDLSFAGRFGAKHPVHGALAGVAPGDTMTLRENGSKFELCDVQGHVTGRLAKAFKRPEDMSCVSAKVDSIVVRTAEDSEAEYRDQLKVERWEVVVPELVYEPCLPR